MSTANLKWYATHWSQIAEANCQALGSGWALADELVQLSLLAAERLAENVKKDFAQGSLSASDEATLGLLCHGTNLFTSLMTDIVKGLWDVSSLLMRGMFDVQSLAYACASREEKAREFLDGKLDASACRILLVNDLKQRKSSLASMVDERFIQENWIANSLAHVKVLHTAKTRATSTEVIIPTAWGRYEPMEALAQCQMAIRYENLQLSWVAAFKNDVVGPDWIARFTQLASRLDEFYEGNATEKTPGGPVESR